MAVEESTRAKLNTTSTLTSSAYVGLSTGTLGVTYSALHASLTGRSALLWSTAAGAQCFVLGSTFWFTRSLLRNDSLTRKTISRREDVLYSTIAGSMAGVAGGALRGRTNIIPGAIVFGALGAAGQVGLGGVAASIDSPAERRPLLDRLSDTSWWPLKSLSDEDYEKDLQEQLIGVEADLIMVDERIAALKTSSDK